MHTRALTHPNPQVLAAYALGKLAAADGEVLARHLESCADCRQAVATARSDVAGKGVQSQRLTTREPSPHSPTSLTAGQPDPAPDRAAIPPALANHAKFQIVRMLGQGGMGTVYLAQHRIMERAVAIKVINQSLLAHPEALQRFYAEVRAAAKLQHPNIVTAYDAEQAGDLHLLVMEYVEGADLASYRRQKGPLPVEHACHFVRQAALGLQHAHEKGMVHRDIKPQNLMLTRKGQVKILDFGLARLAGDQDDRKGLTRVGAFMGTPEFVAPEQAADASKADIRADLYSLGCTLYDLLAGGPPFRGETAIQLVLAHLETPAPPVQVARPDVPDGLSGVIAKLLAKAPAERYQRPVEAAEALMPFCKKGASNATELRGGEGVTAAPTAPFRTSNSTEAASQRGTSAAVAAVARPELPAEAARPWRELKSPRPSIGSPTPFEEPDHGGARSRRPALYAVATALGVVGLLLATVVLWPSPSVRVAQRKPESAPARAPGSPTPKTRVAIPESRAPVVDEKQQEETPVAFSKSVPSETENGSAASSGAKAVVERKPPAVAAPPTRATRSGFAPLFNGRDLSDWKAIGQAKWTVENGTLVSRGRTGYLFTNRNNFRDFHLCVDVLPTANANSGLALRCQRRPDPVRIADFDHYEVEILPGNSTQGTGSLLKTQRLQKWKALQPVRGSPGRSNTWLTLEVVAVAKRITVKIDETVVGVYTDDKEPFLEGQLGLQHMVLGSEVRFRNIEIKELLPESVATPSAPDVDDTALSQARKKYGDAKKRAQQSLLGQFDKAIEGLVQRNSLAEKRLRQIDVLKKEKARFERTGRIPWSAPMRGALGAYLGAMSSAEKSLRRAHNLAMDKLLKAKNNAKADELNLDIKDTLRPVIMAQWRVGHAVHTLLSNGKINQPEGTNTWHYGSGYLRLIWPNIQAPGGAWVDTLAISEDGRTYSGANQRGHKLHATYEGN